MIATLFHMHEPREYKDRTRFLKPVTPKTRLSWLGFFQIGSPPSNSRCIDFPGQRGRLQRAPYPIVCIGSPSTGLVVSVQIPAKPHSFFVQPLDVGISQPYIPQPNTKNARSNPQNGCPVGHLCLSLLYFPAIPLQL